MSVTRPLTVRESVALAQIHQKNKNIMEDYIRVRLRSYEPENYIRAADKLREWLSKREAYYNEMRPLIVNMLETAMETMTHVLSLQSGQTFHISLCTSERIRPCADAYRNLVATVRQFFEEFIEVDLKKRLIEVFSTIHVSAAQRSSSSMPTSYPSIFPAPAGTETVSPTGLHVPRETSDMTSRRGPAPVTDIIRSLPATHNLQKQIPHPYPQSFTHLPGTGQHSPSSSNTGSFQQEHILPPLATKSQTTNHSFPFSAYSPSVPMPYTPTGTATHPPKAAPLSYTTPMPRQTSAPLHAPTALGTATRSPSQLHPPQSHVSHASLPPIDTSIPSASSTQPTKLKPAGISSTSTGKPKSIKPIFNINMLRTLAAKDKSHWSKPGKEKSTTPPVGERTVTPPERETSKGSEAAGQGMEIEKVSREAQKDVGIKNTIPTERQQLQVEMIHDLSEAEVNMTPSLPEIKTASGTAPVSSPMQSGVEPFRPAQAPPGEEGLVDVSKEAGAGLDLEVLTSPKSQVSATEENLKVISSNIGFQDTDRTPSIHVLETDDEMEVDEMINDGTCTGEGSFGDGDKGEGVRDIQSEDAAEAIEVEAANISKEERGTLEVVRDPQLSSSNSLQPQQIVSQVLSPTEPLKSSRASDNVNDLVLSLESIALSNPSILEGFICATGFPLDLSRRWRPFTGPAHTNGTIQEQESRVTLTPDMLPPLTSQDYQPKPPYQVITAIGGQSFAGSYSVEFELGEEQLTFAKRWANRRNEFESLPCMCISISCHPVMDNMPESEEEMTLESLVDLFTKEACWPKDGQLQIIVEADGSTGIASTLQYCKEGEPIDLTGIIGRHNKVTFCHTQDHTKFVFFLRAHKPTVAQMRALDELTPGTEAWNAIFKLTTPASWGRGLFFAPKPPADNNSVSMTS